MSDVGIINHKPKVYKDSRGLFFESYKRNLLDKAFTGPYGSNGEIPIFIQDNISVSKKGVIRGMHYQLGDFAQGKFIRCLKGKIFDVVVDLREKTYGQVHTLTLSDEDFEGIFIPDHCAHGFQALTDDTIIHYKITNGYSPEHETGINPLSLGITWPLDITEISEKDQNLPRFT